MVGFLIEMQAVGIDKVLDSHNVGMLEGRDGIAVLETAIEHGNGHALTTKVDVMQSLPHQHLNLFQAVAITAGHHAVPRVEVFVDSGLDESVDTVGRYPDHLRSLHAIEGCQTMEEGGVVGAHEDGVVPAAGANDGPFYSAFLRTADYLARGLLKESEVSAADGQVGRVDGQSLTLTALNGFMGEPARGMVDGVGRALLVLQGIAPDIAFAPRILDLRASTCTCRQVT